MEEDRSFVLERLIESNVFSEEEIRVMNDNRTLIEKCYLVGVLDAKN